MILNPNPASSHVTDRQAELVLVEGGDNVTNNLAPMGKRSLQFNSITVSQPKQGGGTSIPLVDLA